MLPEDLERLFCELRPAVDFCSLRYVRERHEEVSVRQNVPEPLCTSVDRGMMVTVADGGGLGYAATSDVSQAGLRAAIKQATDWANVTAECSLVPGSDFATTMESDAGPQTCESIHRAAQPWAGRTLAEKFDLVRAACGRFPGDERIVDTQAGLWHTDYESLQLTADGGRIYQQNEFLVPWLVVAASQQSQTQRRSHGDRGGGLCRRGGFEVLDAVDYESAPERICDEALALLAAPDCPSETMDLLLAPDQMILQIHESIGHPLETDRILGDERNYAGTSFVTQDMFGSYQYGSDRLNVTYDPSLAEEYASFAYDDEATLAKRAYVIERGILKRPLGGRLSASRSGLPHVANSRACSWNRPPIDRMANLNLEPGDSTLDEMVAAVERGVYMKTNLSWSIDDSRNKFQFGCEWAQLIENGRLTQVVKNPNYRGISATFWRSLDRVGNAEGFELLGTPFCGKGEPNQCVRVGHATPAALFRAVDVFGGA